MSSCRLKINCEKTEFTVFAPQKQLHKCMTREIDVVNQKVKRVNMIKYLGNAKHISHSERPHKFQMHEGY